ncbi:hypothetical protein DAI22_12g192800 [Oryza sativa Japonica Group]|nr:hypothetical protein DAI22_12g192800 [Oryza sativa Japonica Group]
MDISCCFGQNRMHQELPCHKNHVQICEQEVEDKCLSIAVHQNYEQFSFRKGMLELVFSLRCSHANPLVYKSRLTDNRCRCSM